MQALQQDVQPGLFNTIAQFVHQQAGDERRAWMSARKRPSAGQAGFRLTVEYAAAGRAFGSRRLLSPGMPLHDALGDAGIECPQAWTLLDLYRVELLHSALQQVPAARQLAVVRELFFKGGIGEQISLLRGLTLLSDSAVFLPVAIEACRNNVLDVFCAMACENRYPALHFPEINFNQMVMKAMFNGVALSKIAGLSGRLNPEMARMASDYAAERRAAGRSIPADIDMVLEP